MKIDFNVIRVTQEIRDHLSEVKQEVFQFNNGKNHILNYTYYHYYSTM